MSEILTTFRKAKEVRIESVIDARGIQLRGKVERAGACPRCGEGDDRFSVNVKKQLFNCRVCEKGGDVIDLVAFLDKCDRLTAARALINEPKPNGGGDGLQRAIEKKAKLVVVPTQDTTEDAPKDTAAKQVIAATFDGYTDENGVIIYAVDRLEYQNADGSFVLKDGKRKKSFRQRRPDPDRSGAWIYNLDDVTRVPYRLPELIETVAAGRLIYVVEGEACVEALRDIGIAATTNNGGAGKWEPAFNEYLNGADVVLLPDADEAGWKHMNDVGASLVGIAAWIRVVMLPDLPAKGDVKDWLASGGTREQLDALVETAADWQPPSEETPPGDEAKKTAEAAEQALIDELSKLSPIAYDQRRSEAADQINIRRETLDSQVNARRAQREEEEGPPPLFGHWVVEPWDEPVDTGDLILALMERIRRHIVLTDEQTLTVALWILFAWIHDVAAVHSPILLVTSAERDSGKSTLTSIVGYLVPCAFMGTGWTESSLFRSIEKWSCTIVADDADTLLAENEPLRAIVNNSWTRASAYVPRTETINNVHTPRAFPTFCPKVLNMKGRRLPDTTFSRCIVVEMKRKLANEETVHFRSIDDAGLGALRRRCKRWAMDNGEKLDGAEPDLPPGFDNRLGDNWRLLIAVADFAGGEWPVKACKAATNLSDVVEATSTGTQLLAGIKDVFDGGTQDDGLGDDVRLEAIGSAELAERLGAKADSPWAEWGKNGKPITQFQLARELKKYGIYPEKVTPASGLKQTRGYARLQFEDVWARYLSSSPAVG